MGGVTEKNCSKCRVMKPVSAFQPDQHKASGYSSACRDCKNAARRRGRAVGSSVPWSAAEDAIHREHYRTLGAKALMELLPGRTWRAIKARAEREHLLQPRKDYSTFRSKPWRRPYEPPPEWAIAAENALRNFKPCTPAANGPRYLIGAMG